MKRLDLSASRKDTDNVISATSEEVLTISGPGEGGAVNGNSLRLRSEFFADLDGLNALTGFEIEDLDGRTTIVGTIRGTGVVRGSNTEPVLHGREAESVDGTFSFKIGKVTTFREIPEESTAVLTTRSTKRTIRGNGNSVNVARVTVQIVLVSVVGTPDLNALIPTRRNEETVRITRARRETDAGNPVSVTLVTGVNDKLRGTERVRDTDSVIARTGNNSTRIVGEGNGEDILGMGGKAVRDAVLKIPETKSSIPRTGESVLTIGGNGNVLNVVVVAS
jgi:hypothetical protein